VELQKLIFDAMNEEFSQEEILKREKILFQNFSSQSQTEKLLSVIGLDFQLAEVSES
jgi:hypothetical protein